MPALPARKVKAMPYTFNSPITTRCFAGEQSEAAVQISEAYKTGGFKAAINKAKEIRRETAEARKAGDYSPTVEVAVVNPAGDYYSF
jgi:hypothetical protein